MEQRRDSQPRFSTPSFSLIFLAALLAFGMLGAVSVPATTDPTSHCKQSSSSAVALQPETLVGPARLIHRTGTTRPAHSSRLITGSTSTDQYHSCDAHHHDEAHGREKSVRWRTVASSTDRGLRSPSWATPVRSKHALPNAPTVILRATTHAGDLGMRRENGIVDHALNSHLLGLCGGWTTHDDGDSELFEILSSPLSVSYTHLTLPTTPYV